MYKLIEYYEEKDIVYTHIITIVDTIEEINKKKYDLIEIFKECGVEMYEVIATKNIQSMKDILKRPNVKIFNVEKYK